ncbi:MAG: hypothetical protein HY070_05230, partial [Chloroflexi bacterium]|nr:hypothetical protein [Chloroflexota bacterium]
PTPTIPANLLSPCFTTGNPPVTYGCYIDTIAGRGSIDTLEGGPATRVTLNQPDGLAVSLDGQLYISDTNNNKIWRVTPDGNIYTFAGTGSAETQLAGDGRPATQATLRFPRGLAVAPDGSLLIADTNHYRIRRVDLNGIITTIAGTGNAGYGGDGGPATRATFGAPFDVAIDNQGNVYVADMAAHRIRQIGLDGIIRTIAGTGEPGTSGDGGPATDAKINGPISLTLDGIGGLVFTEFRSRADGPIRRIDLSKGTISTFPGVLASRVRSDGKGNIYFASSTGGRTIRKLNVSNGQVTMYADLNPYVAISLALDVEGNLYFANLRDNLIQRRDSRSNIQIIAGGGKIQMDGPAKSAFIFDTQGMGFDQCGNLYFGDFQQNTIRRLSTNGQITTVIGGGSNSADGIHPLQASINTPHGIAFDPFGNLLFLDPTSNFARVRLITPGADGIINGSSDEKIFTIVGKSSPTPREEADRGKADGGPARNAVIPAARALAVDSKSNLYITDGFDLIRKIVPGSDGMLNGSSDEIITTIVGKPTNGIPPSAGDGGQAKDASVAFPIWLTVDSKDNLYIREFAGSGRDRRIRKIDNSTGVISTYAQFQEGIVQDAGTVQGRGLALDRNDNLYFATNNQIVRVDSATGIQTVIAGTGEQGFSGDGGDAKKATFNAVAFIAVDPEGNVYAHDTGNFRIRKITFVPLTPTNTNKLEPSLNNSAKCEEANSVIAPSSLTPVSTSPSSQLPNSSGLIIDYVGRLEPGSIPSVSSDLIPYKFCIRAERFDLGFLISRGNLKPDQLDPIFTYSPGDQLRYAGQNCVFLLMDATYPAGTYTFRLRYFDGRQGQTTFEHSK